MNHKPEKYSSVPELRQQVIQQWYEEWESPEDTLGMVPFQQVLRPLTQLPGLISRFLRPMSPIVNIGTENTAKET